MPCAEHQYKAGAPGVENERTMVFYNVARMDGLAKRVETPTEMTEHFVDRDDFLYYKHTTFGRRPKMFGPQDGATTVAPRPIVVSWVLCVCVCVCVCVSLYFFPFFAWLFSSSV